MNVQDKQQGQARPVGTTGFDARLQAGEPTRPEQAATSPFGAEKIAALTADVERAMELAAKIAGVSVEVLTSRNRWFRPCMMRQIAAYWLYKERGYTQREIGTVFCRDRTSVYHAINRIRGLLKVGDHLTTDLWNLFTTNINL